MTRRPRPIIAAVAAVLLLCAGCGLPANGEVEVLDASEHREMLDGTTSTTLLVADPDESNSKRVKLFFIGQDDKLESVIRPLPDGSVNNDVLEALELGPSDDEIAGFETLQTFIPLGLSAKFDVLDEERGSMPIVVDPIGELRRRVEEEPDQGTLIISQLVCTVLNMNLSGVQGVEIYDGGEDAIPLSDNAAQPIIGPAQIEDFDNCITGAEEREQLTDEAQSESETTDTTDTTAVESTG